MGLFDDLKKLSQDIGKEIEKSGVKEDLSKFGKEFANGVADLGKNTAEFLVGNNGENSTTGTSSSEKVQEIPEAYKDFPAFGKNFINGEEKKTDKYTRFSFDIKDATDEEINEYTSRIVGLGYFKSTGVRYDKDNTYIIVDPDGDYGLRIVFHIKK